jgi:hypothetical protein
MARHGSHARLRPLGVAVVDVGSVGEGDVSRRRRRPGRAPLPRVAAAAVTAAASEPTG